jgi:tetratricopeptide (TPR) repeat protein
MFRSIALLVPVLVMLSRVVGASDVDRLACRPHTGIEAYSVLMACTRVIAMRGIPLQERAEAHSSRGGAYLEVSTTGRAIADYTEAIRHSPGYVDAYLERARLFLRERDFSAALSDCLIVLRISPPSERAYWCAARAYAGVGDTRRALSLLRRALELSPESRLFRDLFPSEPSNRP